MKIQGKPLADEAAQHLNLERMTLLFMKKKKEIYSWLELYLDCVFRAYMKEYFTLIIGAGDSS